MSAMLSRPQCIKSYARFVPLYLFIQFLYICLSMPGNHSTELLWFITCDMATLADESCCCLMENMQRWEELKCLCLQDYLSILLKYIPLHLDKKTYLIIYFLYKKLHFLFYASIFVKEAWWCIHSSVNWFIFYSSNGLLPVHCQAIIWINTK